MFSVTFLFSVRKLRLNVFFSQHHHLALSPFLNNSHTNICCIHKPHSLPSALRENVWLLQCHLGKSRDFHVQQFGRKTVCLCHLYGNNEPETHVIAVGVFRSPRFQGWHLTHTEVDEGFIYCRGKIFFPPPNRPGVHPSCYSMSNGGFYPPPQG